MTQIAHARKTIAVTDRQNRDAAVLVRGVTHPVADVIAGLEMLDRGDAGLDAHHGFDAGNAPAH